MSIEWLAELAWKSLLLAGFTLAVLFLARRRSAAEKSLIGDAGLLSLLLLPFTITWLPRFELPAPPTIAAAVERFAPAGDAQFATAVTSAPVAAEAATAFDWNALMVVLYALPAISLVVGLAYSLLRLRTLYGRARVIEDARWLTALASAQNRVGVKHGTALLLSDEINSPISWGIVRPVIMIDPNAGSSNRAEAIIAHELAHVHRLDWTRLIAARLVVALFWFNPLVWMLARRSHQLREEAADDAVLRARVPTSDYADLLVTAVRHSNAPLLAANGVAPSASSIAQRVHHVLDASRSRRAAPLKWATATLAIALTANAALAASEPVLERSRVDDLVRAASNGISAPSPVPPVNLGARGAQGRPVAAAHQTRGAVQLPSTARPLINSPVFAEAMVSAARSGDIATLTALIAHGANPNAVLRGDGTPLLAAVRAGRSEAARFLLARGADPNLGIPGDGSPLIAASRAGRREVVRLLLDAGARVNVAVQGDGTALIAASAAGHADVVELLLERGADAEQIVPGEENALITASRTGRARVVDLLIARGANVNSIAFGRTPLSVARVGGHAEIESTLASAGAVR